MVFMADSERSADLAIENNLDAGLHLNFTQSFSGHIKSATLIEYQEKIAKFLLSNRYSLLIYNPILKNHFDYIYKSQVEEYVRLYNRNPTHIDGHHHMHLCMNMLINKLIAKGFKVRRNFFFLPGEKNTINRLYRYIIDAWLMRRYTCTDFLFNISPIKPERIEAIVRRSKSAIVELEVHPEEPKEYTYLMSDEYRLMISCVDTGTYTTL